MDTITLKTADNLLWLGRYVERVYSTIRAFNTIHDTLIDINEHSYVDFCRDLSIPNIYVDRLDFIGRYLYDPENPDSVYSNLSRAYDNAIMVRSIINSESIAYIQLALNSLSSSGKHTVSPHIGNLYVIDYILAFWGGIDDYVTDEECRNIIKTGKYVERLDLYIRLNKDYSDIQKECCKLQNRISKTTAHYSKETLDKFVLLVEDKDSWNNNRFEALKFLEGLFLPIDI